MENQIQIKKSDLPEDWSLESADFINKLIQRKSVNRLGYNGIEELKSHPWIQNFPWQKLENRIYKSPFESKATKFFFIIFDFLLYFIEKGTKKKNGIL